MTNDQLLTELLQVLHQRSIAASGEAHRNLDRRVVELVAQLRARLAALEPLAQAAVAYRQARTGATRERIILAVENVLKTARACARAQAQDGAA